MDDSFEHSDGISYEMQTDYLITEGAKTSLNVSLQSHRVQQTFAQRHISRRLSCKKKKDKYPKAWKYKFKSRKFQRLMLRRLVNFKPFSDSEFLVDVTCKKKQLRSLKAWKFIFRTKNLQRFKITRVKHLAPVSDYTVSVLDMRMLGTNQRHLHEFLELREVDWQKFKRSQLNCSFDFVGEQKLVRWWQVVSEFYWLGISCGTTTSVKRTQYNTTSVQPQYFTNLVSGEARYLLLYGFMNVRADTEDVKICQGLLSLLQLYCGHEIGRVTRKLQQRKFYKSWKFKYKSKFLQHLEILSNRLEGNMRHDSQSLIRLLMGETTFQIWHKWRFKSEKLLNNSAPLTFLVVKAIGMTHKAFTTQRLMGIKEIDGNQVWHR